MNKHFQYTLIAILVLAIVFTILNLLKNEVPSTEKPKLTVDGNFMVDDLEEIAIPDTTSTGTENVTSTTTEEISHSTTTLAEVVVENLTIPWDMVFLPNGDLMIVERGGTVIVFDVASSTSKEIKVDGVLHQGEGGLLGMVLHPEFENNSYVYLYKTSTNAGKSINSVIRYTYSEGQLLNEVLILDNIPGALFHNGGRLAFGPDGYLYVATGDAQDPALSQDKLSLAGKILRITEDGGIPSDNPFGNEVYTYGHRNPQGLTWDPEGALWSTEHGRSGVRTGLDELNLIIKGENYGWPESQGDIVVPSTVGPVIHSGADISWAPGGATYTSGSIFFGGLKGETLYEAVLSGIGVSKLNNHFVGEYGRIRSTIIGPDGMLYFMTSNRDGRGTVQEGDDKILRVDVQSL